MGGLAARLAGLRCVIWGIRSSNLERDKTRWTTRAVRRLCAVLSYVIPKRIFINSETARQIHLDLGYAAEKIDVLPNGFDISLFRPDDDARIRLRAELGCSSETLLVGMIGRYDPLKNHAGFFTAMSYVHRLIPAVQLVLAGKGIERNNDELMRLIEEAGLLEYTHLLGPRGDMPILMAGLDILACPSHAEAFPNVVGEAMASGTLCVATDVGDCAYIIGETGGVVPSGDMTNFASSVVSMLKLSRAQRSALSEKARARITSQFEIGSVVRQYEKAYELTRKSMQ
jgi:glycosyltransferase involved in cell wall biosynthesis